MHVPIEGEVMHCVTENAVPLCKNKCNKRASMKEKRELRCVDREEAMKLEMIPEIIGIKKSSYSFSTEMIRC